MNLQDLAPALGSTHVAKRKGRGHGTGNGKTAGRGHKGQKARSVSPSPWTPSTSPLWSSLRTAPL